MRTPLLTLTAAALAAGTLALGPAAPSDAVGGIDGGNISGSGDVPTSVDVAAFGRGDAVAAWSRPVPGGTKVYAAIATDGVWAAPKAVTAAAVTDAHDVRAVANDAGDLAVVWNQTTGGEQKVRGARHLAGGGWDGSTLLSPAVDVTTVTDLDAGMDDAGRVHVAYKAAYAGTPRVRTASWKKGAAPVLDALANWTWFPSLDVNPSGQVLLSYYDGSKIQVTRRTASLGWLAPTPVAWPDSVVGASEAVLAEDGRGAVAIGGWDGPHLRAAVVRVSAAGSLGAAKIVSPPGSDAVHRHLAMSPDGVLQATWSAFENPGNVIRVARALPGKDFTAPSLAQGSLDSAQDHVSLVSDAGVQVVAHRNDDRLTLRHRSNPILTFSTYDAGATNGPFAAAMDERGDVVVAGVVENGFSSYVEADWLDVAGPTSAVTAPGPQVLATSFDVTWKVADALSGAKSSDVHRTSAAWNSGEFATPALVDEDVTTGEHHVDGGLGRTYCFEVQSVDKAGNLGPRSARRCTAVPLDDTALLGSGWTRSAKAGQFNGTWTSTTTKGRTLSRPGVRAKRLALVANRFPDGGQVEVRWNGTLLRKISLQGTTAARQVLPIITWSGLHTGTVTIKVLSPDGRRVRIDGMVVAK